MKTSDGKLAFKNVGSGNYINVKGITRAAPNKSSAVPREDYPPELVEQIIASQPNVSPYENIDAFYWLYKHGTDFDNNLDEANSPYTNILNYGFTTAAGGAISHETMGRTAIKSRNDPNNPLYHIQWRYDEGDPDDMADNAPWESRLLLWGSYKYGIYRNDW
jgi:hypothetical protein